MKSRVLLIGSLLCINFAYAAIWRVSKDITYFPHYGELQKAIDEVNTGDTIYVYPGSYGNITIKKHLTIYGVGYFLPENAKDSLTRFISPSQIGTITFKSGSNNSLISGLQSDRVYCDTVSNIRISGNRVNGISLKSSNNIIINRNYSDQTLDGVKSNNITLNNNILHHPISFDTESSLDIYNNYTGNTIYVYNSNFYNNINYSNHYVYPHTFGNCYVRNNIYVYHGLGTYENNNFQSSLEQIYPISPINDNFKLTEGSTAIGKGIGGIDCGPFGGDDPYRLSGINYIPTITILKIPNQASNTSGLKLNVIVKSNN